MWQGGVDGYGRGGVGGCGRGGVDGCGRSWLYEWGMVLLFINLTQKRTVSFLATEQV